MLRAPNAGVKGRDIDSVMRNGSESIHSEIGIGAHNIDRGPGYVSVRANLIIGVCGVRHTPPA